MFFSFPALCCNKIYCLLLPAYYLRQKFWIVILKILSAAFILITRLKKIYYNYSDQMKNKLTDSISSLLRRNKDRLMSPKIMIIGVSNTNTQNAAACKCNKSQGQAMIPVSIFVPNQCPFVQSHESGLDQLDSLYRGLFRQLS